MKRLKMKEYNSSIKVKITETEIKMFPSKDLKIDPFWLDLYNDPKPKKKLR